MKKSSLCTVSSFMGMLLTALIACTPFSLEAANLHAIIVADTGDFSIGESCESDFQAMRYEVQQIAYYTGLDLKEVTLKGYKVKSDHLLSKLKALDIHSDDVVFFFWSGHGYRTQSKEGNPWPNLYFSGEDKGVDFSYIQEILNASHPRFLLLIADACNSMVEDSYSPPLVRQMKLRASSDLVRENYRSLFLNTSGVVMITSSEIGEFSWCDEEGGFYTLAFLRSLKEMSYSQEKPSWDLLLHKAAMQVIERQPDQHPDYFIELHR